VISQGVPLYGTPCKKLKNYKQINKQIRQILTEMSDTLFSLFEQIFKYNNNQINIIIDNEGAPYFAGSEIAVLLKYDHPQNAILNNVNKIDKKEFKELKHFIDDVPKNMQPHTVYINEAGLYSLIFGSKKKEAKEFKYWVLHSVLPEIRKYGQYQIEEKYHKKLAKLNKQLIEKESIIETLENNQKKHKFPDGGLVYALEPMGIIPPKNGYKMIRVGKSEGMKNRLKTYNSAVPNNFRLIYCIETDHPDALEYCVRAGLLKYAYRAKKDYYVCKLSELIKIFDECDHFINTGEFPRQCTTCDKKITSPNVLMNHLKKHNSDITKLMQQTGGSKEFNESVEDRDFNLKVLSEIEEDSIFDEPLETERDVPLSFRNVESDEVYSDEVDTPSLTEMIN